MSREAALNHAHPRSGDAAAAVGCCAGRSSLAATGIEWIEVHSHDDTYGETGIFANNTACKSPQQFTLEE